MSQPLSKCFFKWINWIKPRIPCWIWKNLFVLSCPNWAEFLAMLEGKIGKGPFFRVQSDELTVWEVSLKSLYRLLMVQCFLPGWHFSEAHPACAVQSQFDQILSSGFPAILSINKIRMKIFRIISTNYFWISTLNLKYLDVSYFKVQQGLEVCDFWFLKKMFYLTIRAFWGWL